MPAVRRLLRGFVAVGTLEDAEDFVYAHPELTAVTAEGDLLGAHFAQGGSAGAPSLLEVQASVDEAAAELAELAVQVRGVGGPTGPGRGAAQGMCRPRRGVGGAAQGRRPGEVLCRPAVGAARRAGAGRVGRGRAVRRRGRQAQEALERAVEEAEELAERLAVAEEMPAEEEPDTSVRDRLAATGPTPARPRWRRGSRPVRTRSG